MQRREVHDVAPEFVGSPRFDFVTVERLGEEPPRRGGGRRHSRVHRADPGPAGAEAVVLGSLAFGAADLAARMEWPRAL